MIHRCRIRAPRIPPKPLSSTATATAPQVGRRFGVAFAGITFRRGVPGPVSAVRAGFVEDDVAGFEALEEGAGQWDGGREQAVAASRLLPAQDYADAGAGAVDAEGGGVACVVQG
jgi:hypothetical protein